MSEDNDWNKYALYDREVSAEAIEKAKKVTAEISAIIQEAAMKVNALCEQNRDTGADDTASQDEMAHHFSMVMRYGKNA